MADLITIKSGALGDRSTMPNLNENELGYRTDGKALYIGTPSGNERLCGANDIAEINSKINSINTAIRTIENLIVNIKSRLDKLEKPSE